MPLRTYTLDFPDLGDAGVTSQANFTLQVGVAGADGASPTRRFQITLAAPTTREIPWASGPITLASLTAVLLDAGSGTGTLTVAKNNVAVAGWSSILLDTVDPIPLPPTTPVTLADGDLLRVTWTGDGTDLSLGFSE